MKQQQKINRTNNNKAVEQNVYEKLCTDSFLYLHFKIRNKVIKVTNLYGIANVKNQTKLG